MAASWMSQGDKLRRSNAAVKAISKYVSAFIDAQQIWLQNATNRIDDMS